MEVCVDSVLSAVNAEKGGAARVELCGNLLEGGTTPSIGMLKVMKKSVKLPVFVMIRPRGADFVYSEVELDVMTEDMVALKQAGADGFVFGALKSDGSVDTDACSRLLELARPLQVTFHRAIDMSYDVSVALETVISLGFERVLTSGGASSALEGLPVLRRLVQQAGDRIIVMPGGGITDSNLDRILQGCHAKEFHGSARSSQGSAMSFRKDGISMGASFSPPEFNVKVTDFSRVQKLVAIARSVWRP